MYELTAMMIIVVGICVPHKTGASPPPTKSTTIPIIGSSQQAMNRGETSDEKTAAVSTEGDKPKAKHPRTHDMPQARRLPEMEEVKDSRATTPTQRGGVIVRHTAPIETLGRAHNRITPQGSYRTVGAANNPPKRPAHTVRPLTVVATPKLPTEAVDASSPHQSTSITIPISAAARHASQGETLTAGPSGIGEPQSKRPRADNVLQAQELLDSRPTTSTERQGGRPTTSTERQGGRLETNRTPSQPTKFVPAILRRRGPEAPAPVMTPPSSRVLSAPRKPVHHSPGQDAKRTASTEYQGVIMQHTAPIERQGGHAAQRSCHSAGPVMAQVPPTAGVTTPNQPTKFVPAILRRRQPPEAPAAVMTPPPSRVLPAPPRSRPVRHSPGQYPFWMFVMDRLRAGVHDVRWENEGELIFRVHDTAAFAEAWRPFSRTYHDRPSMPFSVIACNFRTLRNHGKLEYTCGYLEYKWVRTDEIVNYLANSGAQS